MSTGMRFAFADPPYPGQSKRHYSDHADYAGEVDHGKLAELHARVRGHPKRPSTPSRRPSSAPTPNP